MNLAVPGKIVLKSSTSKSLSDRFGEIEKASQVENVRNKQRAENVASVKNRRLAAQMTKRLGNEETTVAQQGTIKSRLSIPISNRLGAKSGVRGRGGSVRTQRGSTRGRGGLASRIQSGRGLNRGQNAARGRGTTRGGRIARGGRGGALRGSRGGRTTRGQGRQMTNRGRQQGTTRGGRGRGRGRRGGKKTPLSKEALDSELDTYMSKTRSALNSQLDEYMKGSD